MSVFKNHPVYLNFIENEIKTLGFLKGYSRVENSFYDLSKKAELYYYQFKGKGNNTKLTTFQFSCQLDLKIEKKIRKIIIDAKVTPDFSPSTYVMTLCEGDESSQVIRKFHFDYDPEIEVEDKKPIYHVQYGGKPTNSLNQLNLDIDHLQPWLSVPRINSTPINLALFLDIIFNEFQSETTKQITETKEWRDLIKLNESVLLKDYYQSISDFFNRSHKYDYLLREFKYGK